MDYMAASVQGLSTCKLVMGTSGPLLMLLEVGSGFWPFLGSRGLPKMTKIGVLGVDFYLKMAVHG